MFVCEESNYFHSIHTCGAKKYMCNVYTHKNEWQEVAMARLLQTPTQLL